MLTIARFLQANDEWEESAERDKTCSQWKYAYKQVHAKVRVKAQAHEGNVKFGAANPAACQENVNPPLDNQLEEDSVGLKALRGYFNNLAVAAVTKKGVLQQLVLNSTTIYISNDSLLDFVKKVSGDIKNLERKIYRLEKGRQVSVRNTTLWANCKK